MSKRIFTSVVRIVVTAVATVYGGPLAGAITSAVATGATGGSFKDALVAGGTTYIGASIGQGLSESLSAAGEAVNAGTSLGELGSIVGEEAVGLGAGVANAGTNSLMASGATAALPGAASGSGWLSELLAEKVPDLVTIANTTTPFAQFTGNLMPTDPNMFGAASRTAFDVLNKIGSQSLGQLGATAVGSLSGLSLESSINDALDAADIESLKKAGFTDEAIKVLTEERKRQLVQQQYDKIRSSTTNPGLPQDEFDKIISTGLDQVNKSLGGITKQQFDTVFSDPASFGTKFLDAEQTARRGAFTQKLKTGLKPGSEIFTPTLDDDAITRILDEQEGPAFKQIGNLEARGALNQVGGKTARQSITTQRDAANTRLQGIGGSVLTRNTQNYDSIRNEGLTGAENYKLGDELFNEQPYVERGSKLKDELIGSLEGDIRTQLGGETLFDTNRSISGAGRSQGVVSGKPGQNSLLDALAERGLEESRKRRGLGTTGSGAF